ncbi:hypothetical protein QR680_013846 [Steinernema hermaphroditum]|uniref:Uncharacterized protein n=1 Tax=Steinernema hermaphroditum TaxID=289476 RepID=A0AA39I6V5_9BILA|nr:hypothetical protein QR680_013846 [Steinernema hermaphroditum]
MRIYLLILAFVGLSAALPAQKLHSSEAAAPKDTFLSSPYTRQHHRLIVDYLNMIRVSLNEQVFPKEVHEFVHSLSDDDFEALRVIITDQDCENRENCSVYMKEEFPQFVTRAMSAVVPVWQRLESLSWGTLKLLGSMLLYASGNDIPSRVKTEDHFALFLIEFYWSWPQENRDELDQQFPNLSHFVGEQHISHWVGLYEELKEEYGFIAVKHYTKKDYIATLEELQEKGSEHKPEPVFPREFYDFVDSLTESDYEAVKLVLPLVRGIALNNYPHNSDELITKLHRNYPDFFKRAEVAIYSFGERYNAMSTETRELVSSMRFSDLTEMIAAMIFSVATKGSRLPYHIPFASAQFLQWPKKNQEEVGTILPGLSSFARCKLPCP